jgi:hypothetical protein
MNNCKNCGTETKNPKFCSSSCAASFNNKGVRRHGKETGVCIECGSKKSNYSAKFCSIDCFHSYRKNDFITKWLNGENDGCPPIGHGLSKRIRQYLMEQQNNSCIKCGWSEVNKTTGKVPLEINHIDGDWRNNNRDNIELICPNCHSLTPTHKALNRGNGRPHVKYNYD